MTDIAKGYWVVHNTVFDAVEFENYKAAAGPALAAFKPTVLAMGGQFEQAEGSGRDATVVIEFESYAAAVECYHSEAYQTAVALRKDIAEFDFVILEGMLPA